MGWVGKGSGDKGWGTELTAPRKPSKYSDCIKVKLYPNNLMVVKDRIESKTKGLVKKTNL